MDARSLTPPQKPIGDANTMANLLTSPFTADIYICERPTPQTPTTCPQFCSQEWGCESWLATFPNGKTSHTWSLKPCSDIPISLTQNNYDHVNFSCSLFPPQPHYPKTKYHPMDKQSYPPAGDVSSSWYRPHGQVHE
jgi:hypothetical protein